MVRETKIYEATVPRQHGFWRIRVWFCVALLVPVRWFIIEYISVSIIFCQTNHFFKHKYIQKIKKLNVSSHHCGSINRCNWMKTMVSQKRRDSLHVIAVRSSRNKTCSDLTLLMILLICACTSRKFLVHSALLSVAPVLHCYSAICRLADFTAV
jgi:hypothetical protein